MKKLINLNKNETSSILKIPSGIYGYLFPLGFVVNEKIKILGKMRCSVLVELKGAKFVLGNDVANQIEVL